MKGYHNNGSASDMSEMEIFPNEKGHSWVLIKFQFTISCLSEGNATAIQVHGFLGTAIYSKTKLNLFWFSVRMGSVAGFLSKQSFTFEFIELVSIF